MNQKAEQPVDVPQDEERRLLPHPGYQENLLKDLPPWMTTQEAAEISAMTFNTCAAWPDKARSAR